MSNYRDHFIALACRTPFAVVVMGVGVWLFQGAGGSPALAFAVGLFGMACIVLAAVIVARPLAAIFAEPFGNLFYRAEYFDRPQPMYSIYEAKRKQGLYREAFDGFQQIAREFPQYNRPYVQMLEIAAVDLKDAALAKRVYDDGLAILKDQEDRAVLTRMYSAFTQLLPENRLPAPGPLPPPRGIDDAR